MKNITLSAIAMAFVMVSCNQKNKEGATNSEVTEPVTQTESTNEHQEGNQHNETKSGDVIATATQSTFSIKELISNYLTLKNALTKDDTRGAADAGNVLYATFNKVNSNSIDATLKAGYLDIAEDAKEHAEHIGNNSGKIEHQREHFVMLSKDMNDLIKTFGAGQKLYQDFCPMADDGKGAIWISEIKEIKNPYLGSKMPKCGVIKEEL
ncbi:DUF3347 domain-containing protein [Flavobacterium cellulosilyticum]|uniref:DUF3347 domain-containing protein n=2 Tax=Flavobacterium TaxID=237 RepID=A0A4R5CFS0_9FLAO|nr:DUF3347 domain-containing protein [Flavobacterium cellulosilyticum]TDD97879.1 DUF3347 domain-containing protein [Flavobacterium cellulosilyticum]